MVEIGEIWKTLRELSNFFNKHNIEYVLVGGITVIIYGRIRATTDVDFIINNEKLDINEFVREMGKKGFSIFLEELKRLKEGMDCNFYLKDSMFRIDIKGINDVFDRDAIDNSIELMVKGIKLRVNDPVILILNKIRFGSEQNYEDAVSVFIRKKGEIDLNKLRRYAEKYGLIRELNQTCPKNGWRFKGVGRTQY